VLPEDVVHFEPISSVSVLPWIEEVPLGANFVHGCSFAHYRCQLSSEARFFPLP
jgi:hypothetical protein